MSSRRYHKMCKDFPGIREDVRLLKRDHEEAGDRNTYHISQAVTVQKWEKIVVASSDTDIFICLLYHFKRWNFLNLQEMWMLYGQGTTKRAKPIHEISKNLDNTIIDILPQVHAMTGCDTTSKIETKRSVLQVATTVNHLLKPLVNCAMNFNAETMPPTFTSIIDHIKRAY